MSQKNIIAILASLMGMFVYFGLTSIGTFRHFLIVSDHFTHAQIDELSSSYIYGDTFGLFIAIFLLTKIQIKTTLISSFYLALICFICFACVKMPEPMILIRFASGFCHAFVFLSVLRLISHYYSKKEQGFYFSICISIILLGGVASGYPLHALLSTLSFNTSVLVISGFFSIIGLIGIYFLPNIRLTLPNRNFPFFQVLQSLRIMSNWMIALNIATLSVPIMLIGALFGSLYLQNLNISLSQASTICSMIFIGFISGGVIWGIIDKLLQSREKTLFVGSILTSISIIIFFILQHNNLLIFLGFLIGALSSSQSLSYALVSSLNLSKTVSEAMSIINVLIMFFTGVFQSVINKLIDNNISEHVLSFKVCISLLTATSAIFAYFLLRNSNTTSEK